MILVTIKILVPQESHTELMQTIQSLLASIKVQSGCLNVSLSPNSFLKGCNQAALSLREEWETQADVDAHLRSNEYAVLLGAVSVLRGAFEIEFNAVSVQVRARASQI
jgi:quinol monooxygenase YgiN